MTQALAKAVKHGLVHPALKTADLSPDRVRRAGHAFFDFAPYPTFSGETHHATP